MELDTIPCDIIYIMQGQATIVPEGRELETTVPMTMLKSYQFNGQWNDVVDGQRVPRAGLSPTDYDLDAALKYTGGALKNASSSFAAGGALIMIGGGLLAVSGLLVSAQDFPDPSTINALSIVGASAILLGGGTIISVAIPLDRAGKRLKRVKLKATEP